MAQLFRHTFRRLEQLGRVSIKQIFGVTAFYVDHVLLVLHKSGELYLRGTPGLCFLIGSQIETASMGDY
ncbi:TfoX/Sxy family protein, partial [Vibrio sp. 10N.247.311.13]|uniref:TfoX/Sxy family protein n=1 Tax=Vibrio sp. 10N.247.311.13 TaxID=3229992 RepID=UPI00354E5697